MVKVKFNKNFNFTEATNIGRYLLKNYKAKYHKCPLKYPNFVNGNERLVNAHTKKKNKI